jgi:hypothetical protein
MIAARHAKDKEAAEMARQLADGSLDGVGFGHASHVRVARWYVAEYGAYEALGLFSRHLREYAESLGSTKYNQTITWALLLTIAERVAAAPAGQTWEEFAADNLDLLEFPGVLDALYTRETLHSPRARTHFVMPDRVLAVAV